MTVFLSTLNQMGFLMLLIAIGYLLARIGAVPESGAKVLSKLENNLFVPALALGTFMQNFTVKSFKTSGLFLLGGAIVIGISIPLAILISRLCTKDAYIRKIYTYGLAFANFGFMGNAVVQALFPDIFMEYLIFVLPFWFMIYAWAVPCLLIPAEAEQGERSRKERIKAKIKPFINPMLICVFIGMILGLLALPIPSFINTTINTLGSCMSPIAMLLTGMTIAKIDLKVTFTNTRTYIVSVVRLFLIPLLAILLLKFIPMPEALAICTVCSLAMPLGLNTIVVPSAYGLDTSDASGMALISHLLSCLSIPLIFMLFQAVVI